MSGSDVDLWQWIGTTTPVQFVIGVLILVFGSRQILSEKSLTNSFSGLSLPFRWLARRKDYIAEAEAQEVIDMRKTLALQHRYILYATRRVREYELWAAGDGRSLPPPPFLTFPEWEDEQDE